MKRRYRRQKQHKRKYRRYSKIVNPGVRYPVVARKAILTPRKKALFTYLADPNYFKRETGGYLDFNKKDLQRVWMEFAGKKGKDQEVVDIPADEDWEVLWHTHPYKDAYSIVPSPDDIFGSLVDQPDVNLIWLPGGNALVINRTKKMRMTPIAKRKIKNKIQDVEKDIERGIPKMKGLGDYYKIAVKSLNERFADMGLRFDLSTAQRMSIPVKVKEPRRKKVRRAYTWVPSEKERPSYRTSVAAIQMAEEIKKGKGPYSEIG